MPVDLIVTPPPAIVLRVQPMPRIQIRVGFGSGGGGGAGTVTQIISSDLSVDVTNPLGPIVDLSVPATGGAPDPHAPSHEDGGSDEISIAGLSGRASDAQDADVIVTPGGNADVTGTTGSNGDVLTSDGAGNWRMQTPPGGGDPWFFFHQAPAAPHADDDNFTTTGLNARWMLVSQSALTTPVVSSGPVTRAGAFGIAPIIRITPNYRGTWLAYQGADGGVIRQFAIPSTLQIRFRITAPVHDTLGGSFSNLYVGRAPAGVPDLATDFVRWGMTNGGSFAAANTNSMFLLPVSRFGGGVFDGGRVEFMAGSQRDMELILLFTSGGSGVYEVVYYVRQGTALDRIHTTQINGAPGDNYYMYWRNNHQFRDDSRPLSSSIGVNALALCDFIRIRTDDDLEAY